MLLITLPATGKAMSIAHYARAIRVAREHPGEEFKHGLTTWYPCTGAQIMRQFRDGCRERMQRRMAYRWSELPRADRYRVQFDAAVERAYLRMLRPELRPDANPRLCGDLIDSERRMVRWRARQVAQRRMRRA